MALITIIFFIKYDACIILFWQMLTSAPKALVKVTKDNNIILKYVKSTSQLFKFLFF
jgi:hypothetical protein